MSFIDDFAETFTKYGEKAVDKTKEVSYIAKRKAQILDINLDLNKLYAKLGKAYLKAHGDEAETEFSEITADIKKNEALVAQLNKEIAEKKND